MASQLLITRFFPPLIEILSNVKQLTVLQDVQTYSGVSTSRFLLSPFFSPLYTCFISVHPPRSIITWALILSILILCIIEGP